MSEATSPNGRFETFCYKNSLSIFHWFMRSFNLQTDLTLISKSVRHSHSEGDITLLQRLLVFRSVGSEEASTVGGLFICDDAQ